MSKVLLLGSNGGIGSRYKCIFQNINKLGQCFTDWHDFEVVTYDLGSPLFIDIDITHALIATPTHLHYQSLEDLRVLAPSCKEVLIEKPMFHMEHLYDLAEKEFSHLNIRMVCNYLFLLGSDSGPTLYSNFFQGRESHMFNLFQIIGLAESYVEIDFNSPNWVCMINGQRISRESVDESYVSMIVAWLLNKYPLVDIREGKQWHLRGLEWESLYRQELHQQGSLEKFSCRLSERRPSLISLCKTQSN